MTGGHNPQHHDHRCHHRYHRCNHCPCSECYMHLSCEGSGYGGRCTSSTPTPHPRIFSNRLHHHHRCPYRCRRHLYTPYCCSQAMRHSLEGSYHQLASRSIFNRKHQQEAVERGQFHHLLNIVAQIRGVMMASSMILTMGNLSHNITRISVIYYVS